MLGASATGTWIVKRVEAGAATTIEPTVAPINGWIDSPAPHQSVVGVGV